MLRRRRGDPPHRGDSVNHNTEQRRFMPPWNNKDKNQTTAVDVNVTNEGEDSSVSKSETVIEGLLEDGHDPMVEMTSFLSTDVAGGDRIPYELYLYYFTHGIQEDLPSTALYLILKNTFHLQAAEFSWVSCLNWTPWALKPVFGYISDQYPIYGQRRKPYFAMGITLTLLLWLLLASYEKIHSHRLYIAILWANSVATVLAETAVDSLLAEMARLEANDRIGALQSRVWTCNAAGSVVGAAIPIVAFYYEVNPGVILWLNAGVVGLSALAMPFIREQPHVATDKQLPLSECFHNPLLVRSLVFVFIVSSSPTSGDAFTYFQTDVLGFSASFISWTTVIQTAANFVAAFLYGRFLRKWNMRMVFQNTIVFTMLIGLVNVVVVQRWNVHVGIPDRLFVVGDTLAQGVAGEVIFMPVAVLAAQLAPAGREGTVYSIVMSVLNVAWATSAFLSGAIAKLFSIRDGNYQNLSYVIVTVSALTLIPLLFLQFVPELSQLTLDSGESPKKNRKSPSAGGTSSGIGMYQEVPTVEIEDGSENVDDAS